MLAKLLKNEAGYSLVEVMVAIILLAIAIIPMVSMFDTGIKIATQGSDYDRARTLANKQLERAKNLSYQDVQDKFPVDSSTPSADTGVYESSNQTDAEYPGFTYKVRKAYAALGSTEITEDASARTMIKVTVTVNWDSDKSYSTTGVVSK